MGLELKDISKQFGNSKKDTVSHVSLDVRDGEFISIIGPSGCGKSTILNMIAGLEKVTGGEIRLDGNLITDPGSDRVVMFQESALFPWLSVIDNVKFGLKIAGIPKEEQEERAMHYLNMVHLGKFKKYHPHELSGGMKQRVALARALTMDSKVLLMDEPFASLDKQTRNFLRDEIQNIWMETRKTVVFITHSVEEAVFLSDRVALMSTTPGTIQTVMTVDLPRPRKIDSDEFVHIRKELLNQLRKEVDRVAQEEYDRN
ncbi:MAG: ABC transporter ATP-binding protein [Lachnoclostridium sp.]|jgi:NitT/TauT family transport system ATP-binding protein|nr:ABC transporter ATP-binding protein [Lachnoclostridium sp.]